MRNFNRLIEQARALYPTNKKRGEFFHVAFLMKGKHPVMIHTNSYEKHNPVCNTYKPTKPERKCEYQPNLHAEQVILGKLKYHTDVSKYTLVLIRLNAKLEIANSCPCPNCAYHLGKSKIKTVYYSTDNKTFERF